MVSSLTTLLQFCLLSINVTHMLLMLQTCCDSTVLNVLRKKLRSTDPGQEARTSHRPLVVPWTSLNKAHHERFIKERTKVSTFLCSQFQWLPLKDLWHYPVCRLWIVPHHLLASGCPLLYCPPSFLRHGWLRKKMSNYASIVELLRIYKKLAYYNAKWHFVYILQIYKYEGTFI